MDQVGVHRGDFTDSCRDETSDPALICWPVQRSLQTGTNRAQTDSRGYRDQIREDKMEEYT